VSAPPETDVARIRKYCRARVPASFRDQIRVEAAVRGSSVSIYECRPPWHPDLTEWSKVRVAQLRYNADTHHWSLYWADRNGRWHAMTIWSPARSTLSSARSKPTQPASSGLAVGADHRDYFPITAD
jgi:hypothetical protein